MNDNLKKSFKTILRILTILLFIQNSACKEKGKPYQLYELMASDFKIEEIGYGGFVGKSGSEYSFKQVKDSVLVTKKTLFVRSELLKRKITNQVYSNIKDEILCLAQYSSPYINEKYSLGQPERTSYKLENRNTEIQLHIKGLTSCKLYEIFIENELQPNLTSN